MPEVAPPAPGYPCPRCGFVNDVFAKKCEQCGAAQHLGFTRPTDARGGRPEVVAPQTGEPGTADNADNAQPAVRPWASSSAQPPHPPPEAPEPVSTAVPAPVAPSRPARELGPRQKSSGGCGGCLVWVVLGLLVLGLAQSCPSGGSTGPGAGSDTPTPTRTAALPRGTHACPQLNESPLDAAYRRSSRDREETTCVFAENIRTAYLEALAEGTRPSTVTGYSATLGHSVSARCSGTDPVVCITPAKARIFLF